MTIHRYTGESKSSMNTASKTAGWVLLSIALVVGIAAIWPKKYDTNSSEDRAAVTEGSSDGVFQRSGLAAKESEVNR